MRNDLLREQLHAHADALIIEPPDVRPLIAAERQRKARFRTGVVGLLLIVGISLVLSTRSDRDEQTPITRRIPASLEVIGNAPIPMASETTLSQAAEMLSFPILRPQVPLASDLTLDKIWVGGQTQQVALVYRSGVLVLLDPSPYADPLAHYRAIVDQFGSGFVTHIGVAPALVLTGDSTDSTTSIDMVIGGVHIQIQGSIPSVTLDDMIQLASSIPQG